MPIISGPYKNSIWERDPRYDLDRESLSKQDFETISRLGAVDIAKKRVPPVPAAALLDISKAAKQMTRAGNIQAEDVQHYLDTTLRHHGAGIATVICMLAVESDGHFPPMDRKFAAGLRAKKVISAAEEKRLNGKGSVQFCTVYVDKVIPAWNKSRRTRSPMQADNYWGRGGVDEVRTATRSQAMAQPCDRCGKLFATSALLQLHLFESHRAAPAPKRLQKARSKPLINDVPTDAKDAAKADKKTRPKRSTSIKTVPGGRSLTKFR